jgi:MFS family permease
VCEDNWKPATGQSLFFIGSVLGSLGLGVMADHIGRLPVLMLSNILALLGNVATSFTCQLPEFAASRLLAGLAVDTNFCMMYIIGENRASWGGIPVLF